MQLPMLVFSLFWVCSGQLFGLGLFVGGCLSGCVLLSLCPFQVRYTLFFIYAYPVHFQQVCFGQVQNFGPTVSGPKKDEYLAHTERDIFQV